MSGAGAFLVAFAGGLASFLSPCTLPLVPGFLAYMGGITVEDVQEGRKLGPALGAALLFVVGFSIIFVALGASLSYLGSLLLPNRALLERLAGAFIILMAVVMIGPLLAGSLLGSAVPGSLGRRLVAAGSGSVALLGPLTTERRLHVSREWGIWSALPLGMAFGVGWSPCITPILGSISVVATTEGTATRGALLLFVYALGLGLPFVALALGMGRLGTLTALRRGGVWLNGVGAAVLLVMGIFLILGRWTELISPLMRWYANLPV